MSTMDDVNPNPSEHSKAVLICANCGAERAGDWCQHCGQHCEATHRSVRRLCIEAFEHIANVDGKVLGTMRGLFFHPARLTRAYLEGHRVVQVAPMNLFLVILVLFLFVAGRDVQFEMVPPTAADLRAIPKFMHWIVPISAILHDHESSFMSNLGESAEMFGLLTVPVAAVMLWGLFAWPRCGLGLYDHLIFALHSLSFQFILLGILVVLPDSLSILMLPLLAVMVVHLFCHMRGVYGRGVGSTLARMWLLGAGTLVASFALLSVWLAVAYAALWI